MDACASGEAEKWKARETALLYRFILGGLASAYGVLGLVGSTYDQHPANWKSYLLNTWMPKKQFGKRSGVARRLLQAQANAVPAITPCSASGGFRTNCGSFPLDHLMERRSNSIRSSPPSNPRCLIQTGVEDRRTMSKIAYCREILPPTEDTSDGIGLTLDDDRVVSCCGGMLSIMLPKFPAGSDAKRDVSCYLGLRPRRSQSGDSDPQLGITKAGNGYLRQLLVECANHVVGPRGKDSALRQWGLSLGARGGSHARRRAVVAVARKLAVLLHRIWITQEAYVPFHAIPA